jgi:hypothetical protein
MKTTVIYKNKPADKTNHYLFIAKLQIDPTEILFPKSTNGFSIIL